MTTRIHINRIKPIQFNVRVSPILRQSIRDMGIEYQIEQASLVRLLLATGMKHIASDLNKDELAEVI